MMKTNALTRLRAHQSPDVRNRSITMERVRRVYVILARDKDLRDKFDAFVEDLAELRDGEASQERAERLEANMFILLAPSGAGKSRALRRLFEKHPLTQGYGDRDSDCPIISVVCPSPCSMVDLGREILKETGWEPTRQRIRAPALWRMVRRRLQEMGVVILHLDELQHAPQSLNAVEQQKLRNALKAMLVDLEHPIGLVISGMPEIEPFIHPDRQVARRGYWLGFEMLAMPGDIRAVSSTVRKMAEVAALDVAPDIERTLIPRLVHAGCYQMGIVCEEIHDAIRYALRHPIGALTIESFASAYAFRTNSLERWNPYLAQNYRVVDPTKAMMRRDPPPAEPTPKARKGRKA